jgi:hypothetical protein
VVNQFHAEIFGKSAAASGLSKENAERQDLDSKWGVQSVYANRGSVRRESFAGLEMGFNAKPARSTLNSSGGVPPSALISPALSLSSSLPCRAGALLRSMKTARRLPRYRQ